MIPEVFAVWKPKGPSSNGVLNHIRHVLGTKKVGHAGTLDPLAEGILIVGVGKGTKKLTELVLKEKEYLAHIKLGAESTTDDGEGEIKINPVLSIPSEEKISEVVSSFIGKTEQVPPIWSALKVKGKEAYKLARKGEDFSLKARTVEVKSAKIIKYSWPDLQILFVTGPGVYIRSLARDIGNKLGVGGYLTSLVRTRVENFKKEDCLDMDDMTEIGA